MLTMRIKFDEEFPYLAMDENGKWNTFSVVPNYVEGLGMWSCKGEYRNLCNVNIEFDGDWKDSLHELKDGAFVKIQKIPSRDKRVMVKTRDGRWKKRYSTGEVNADGHLVCCTNQKDDWTGKDNRKFSYAEWRLPTIHELTLCIPKHDEMVLVRRTEDENWYARYSTGELNSEGHLVCYIDGFNSLQVGDSVHHQSSWEYWKKILD